MTKDLKNFFFFSPFFLQINLRNFLYLTTI